MVKNKHLLNEMSSELAYWIGYIAADGCIKKDYTKLTFCIKDTDVILLEKLVEYFDVTNPIRLREVFDKRTNKTYGQANLQICDVSFVKALSKYNLTATKSKDFFIPDSIINSSFFFDFLRGLIDGDGHISVSNSVVSIGVMSTKKAIHQIQQYLFDNLNISKAKVESKSNNFKFEAYRFSVYKDSIKLLEAIYKNGYVLERKYKKYLEGVEAEGLKSKGMWGTAITRAVDIFSKENVLLGSFNSLIDAAKFLKIDSSTLSNIISGQNNFNRDYVVVAKNYYKQKFLRNGQIEITECTAKN